MPWAHVGGEGPFHCPGETVYVFGSQKTAGKSGCMVALLSYTELQLVVMNCY